MATPVPISASAATDSTSATGRRRYQGVRSFEEPDHARFFGRTDAIEELLLRVLSVRFLLQFAPSGVGKTSLLNAGLFPKLRLHPCFPFIVRLNRDSESLTQAATRSLRDAAFRNGLKEAVIPEHSESLRDLLAGVQLWSDSLLLLTPVLVFDQFEEVFTLRDEAFRLGFAQEIGELLGRPTSGRSVGRSRGESGKVSPVPDVKVIISLREEYLGKLEEFSGSIPDLFHERLRLAPLSADEAKEAMLQPAKLEGDQWLSPSFEYGPACLDWLIDFIDGSSDKVKIIEPLTLQLVCQRAEEIVAGRTGPQKQPARLQIDDFGGLVGLDRIVQDYVTSELANLPGPRTRNRVRQLFEQGLLDPTGKRLMLEQGEIERGYGIDLGTLNTMVERHLLRREPRNDSDFFEISHDRLAETIAGNRRVRLPRWVRPTIATGAVLIVAVLAVAMNFKAAERRADDARAQADRAREHTETTVRILLGGELVWHLYDAGLSDVLASVVDQVQIDKSSPHLVALKLRHQADILRERGTVRQARDKLTEALSVLDTVVVAPRGGDVGLLGERARTLRRLGSIWCDIGQVAKAEPLYAQSVAIWEIVLKGAASSEDILDAAETRVALGALRQRMGDLGQAEAGFIESLQMARLVLSSAYEDTGDHRGGAFEMGHAMQIYTDAAQYLASVWGRESETRGALALARELLRLRPLSFQARMQVGAASAASIWTIDDVRHRVPMDLLSESKQQFDELTQSDPNNFRLQRERTALQLLGAQAVGACVEDPRCKRTLRDGALENAEASTLGSIGNFRSLAGRDDENRSLQTDVAWGLEARAELLSALGSPAKGLPILDEALAMRRKAGVDPRDIENRLSIVNLFRVKARLLERSGKVLDALAALDESLLEAEHLPEKLISAINARLGVVDARIELLKKLRRTAEADRLVRTRKDLETLMGTPWEVRRKRALAMNTQAVQFHDQAQTLTGAVAAGLFRRAVERYELAITENPFDPTIWKNLQSAHGRLATIAEELEISGAPDDAPSPEHGKPAVTRQSHRLEREGALRGALFAAWMTTVLSAEATPSDSGKSLYEARRSLAQLLREGNRKEEMLLLGAQALIDAERYASQKPRSPDAIFSLADANVGLGMLRSECGDRGWEEALRKGIALGDRLATLEPGKIEHTAWVGGIRAYLGARLREAHREKAAGDEFQLAVPACRAAVHKAKPGEGHLVPQSCRDVLATLGDK
jgi:tetratricopeptide (TPR) repeat protein